MARHPKLALDITLSDRVVDLVEEGFDCAVRIDQLPASTLSSRRLASTRLVLCASPGYLRRRGAPAQPSSLPAHDVISYSLFSSGENWSFTGPQGEEVSVKVLPRVRTNSGDTCRAAALQDQGLILQPSFIVGPDLAAGTLVETMAGYRARWGSTWSTLRAASSHRSCACWSISWWRRSRARPGSEGRIVAHYETVLSKMTYLSLLAKQLR